MPVGASLKFGARLLWKSRSFTVVALTALALGMGATTAIFSVVDTVLFKQLPFRDPDRLLVVWEKNAAQHKFKLFVAASNFDAWRKQSQTLESIAALRDTRLNLTAGPNGHIDPEELRVERATASLFPMLGVQPVAGRTFAPDEDQPGRANFAVLGHRLWERRFASDPGILGKTIVLGGQSYTVTGVLPAGFSVFDQEIDLWNAMGLDPADPRIVSGRALQVVARMREGVSLEQVRAELDTIGAAQERANPAVNTGWRPSAYPLRDELVGSVRQPLLVLLGAVGLLLLMACVNVANLLLARGAGRYKEIAVRTAVGARRSQVVGQLLTESLLLSVAAGVIGLVLARFLVAAMTRLALHSIPRLADAQLDWRLFLFAMAASVATGVLFGIAPALVISGANLNEVLREGGRGGTAGKSGRRLRSLLVVAEIALAVLVLIGAGLLMRSFQRLRAANPGFDGAQVLTFRMPMAGGRNGASDRRAAFLEQVSDRLAALPGVRAVGAISSLPLTGLGAGDTFAWAGRPLPPPDERPLALVRPSTPSYFRAMGIRLIAGREFTAADSAQSRPVAVVSESLLRRTGVGPDAIGQSLVLTNGKPVEIVGIVMNVKADRIEGEDWPTIYVPHAQSPAAGMSVLVRTAGPPLSLASAVERTVHGLDPDQPVAEMRPMEAVVDRSLAGARFNTTVLAVFAAIAFVLAAVGIYGVVAYDVTERTQEIGIRMAMGAQPRDVFRLVVGGTAMRLAPYGLILGLIAATRLTPLMESMLYGVKAMDAGTYAAIAVALYAVALAASYVPARRAVALDTVTALRHE